MRIDLSPDCFVDVEDGYNYVLRHRRVAKESGRVVERVAGYFNDLGPAVDKALLLELAGPGDVEAVRGVIKGIYRTVAAAREVTGAIRSRELKKLPELLEKPTKGHVEEALAIVRRALS